tara:strand:+ start:382 stop:1602 length:1221 start_codon:yes stop_codon:yes gene_type:complete
MAAQSSLDLSSPLARYNALPTVVNWRGGWDEDTEYYRNDIVVSPLTSGSYINISASTATRGQGDPSTNLADWFTFGEGAAGVQEIQGSEYITVGPTTTPSITNNGVCEMAIGQNLNNLGTQNDPILEDLGLTNVIPSAGISFVGNTISNTGLISLRPGNSGITVNGTTNVALSCSGVLSITPSDNTITVGAGLTPLITNNGLLSLIASTGLVNNSTAQTPDLENGGVIDISSNGINITDFPNVKLSVFQSSISLIGTLVNVTITPNPSQDFTIPITQNPGTIWATCLATGAPYSTGTFTINFGLAFNVESNQFTSIFDTVITIFDSVNNVAYSPSGFRVNQSVYNRFNLNNLVKTRIQSITIDLAILRASGFRVMTGIQFSQVGSAKLRLLSENRNVFATYNSQVI